MACHNYSPVASRRDFLRTAGCGFGAVAFAALTRSPLLAASGGLAPQSVTEARLLAPGTIHARREREQQHEQKRDAKQRAAQAAITRKMTPEQKLAHKEKQAREQFEGQQKLGQQELEARQKAIDATLAPLRDQLAKQEELVKIVRRYGMRVEIEVSANAFLHHMVRNMAGTLKLVGDGTWPPTRVAEALARDQPRRI